MIREKRFEEIKFQLLKNGIIDADEISSLLNVSRATVRRDLHALETEGALKRIHGGAVTTASEKEQPFYSKISIAEREKREIGITAATLIPEGSFIGCTGGTTVMNVVQAVKEKKISILTNAINIAMELVSSNVSDVIVTGGTLRPRSYELVGYEADAMIAKFHLDIAIIGIDGISISQGISTYTIAEAHTASLYINHAKETWVVADHTKIGKVAPALIAPLSNINTLITDTGVPDSQKKAFEQAGVRVIIAKYD